MPRHSDYAFKEEAVWWLSRGCCAKLCRPKGLQKEVYSASILEGKSLESSCQQGQRPWKEIFPSSLPVPGGSGCSLACSCVTLGSASIFAPRTCLCLLFTKAAVINSSIHPKYEMISSQNLYLPVRSHPEVLSKYRLWEGAIQPATETQSHQQPCTHAWAMVQHTLSTHMWHV